jgi:nicotinamidase-related amidase
MKEMLLQTAKYPKPIQATEKGMPLKYLTPSRSALLVVDIQERLMPVIEGRDQVVKNASLLMKAARVLTIPLLATTQNVARIGALLPEITAELNGVIPLDKMEFGGFGNARVKQAVDRLSPAIDTLIICGVETHICIYQTVMGAIQAGYTVWVPADAVSSRARHNHRTGLGRIREIGGVVANTELIIYELLHAAGTPEFKELLPFLK